MIRLWLLGPVLTGTDGLTKGVSDTPLGTSASTLHWVSFTFQYFKGPSSCLKTKCDTRGIRLPMGMIPPHPVVVSPPQQVLAVILDMLLYTFLL